MKEKKTLRVHSIELLNDEGKECAILKTFNGNPGLHFYDKNQILRIAIGINDSSVSGVTLHDGTGVPVLNICTYNDGSTSVQFFNSAPNYNIATSLDNHVAIGEPRLVLCDKKGKVQFSTRATDDVGDYITLGKANDNLTNTDCSSKLSPLE